jgi:hypothetical protein
MVQALTIALLCSVAHAFTPVVNRRSINSAWHPRLSYLSAKNDEGKSEKPKAKAPKSKLIPKITKSAAAAAKAAAEAKISAISAASKAALEAEEEEEEEEYEAEDPLSSLEVEEEDEAEGPISYGKEPWFQEGVEDTETGDLAHDKAEEEEEEEEQEANVDGNGAAIPAGGRWGPRAAVNELKASKIAVPGVNPFGFNEDKGGASLPQKKVKAISPYSGDPFFQAAPTPPAAAAAAASEAGAVEAAAAVADYGRRWGPRAELEALRGSKGLAPNNRNGWFYQEDPAGAVAPTRKQGIQSYEGDPFFQSSPAAAVSSTAAEQPEAAAPEPPVVARPLAAVPKRQPAISSYAGDPFFQASPSQATAAAAKPPKAAPEQPEADDDDDDDDDARPAARWRPRAQVNELQARKIAIPGSNPFGFYEDKLGGGFVHHAKKRPALASYAGDPFFQAAPTLPAAAATPAEEEEE